MQIIGEWRPMQKAQDTADKFVSSSLQIMGGAFGRGTRPRPFNYQAAVSQFRSWAYAASMLNAWAVATCPLRMYVRKRGGEKLFKTAPVTKKVRRYLRGECRQQPSESVMTKAAEWGDDYEQVDEAHPLLTLLGRPNPYMDGQTFALIQMIYLQLTGNAYIHPVVGKAVFEGRTLVIPDQLWCMPPQFVEIIAAEPKNKEGKLIEAYKYGVSTATMQTYQPDEVIHAKLPNPYDPHFYGLGRVQAGWDCLKIDVAQRETDQSLFDNGARPDYAVIVKNGTQGQLNQMQEQLNRVFRGTQRSGQPILLTGDTTIFPLQWAPKDLGDREIITEEIAAIFGVPVSMLKANDPNLASAQVGFSTWRESTILPFCRLWEGVYNHQLLELFELSDDAILAFDNPVPENNAEVLAENTQALQQGWKTRNEVRVSQGLEPIEGGDELLVPSGYLTLAQALKGPAPLLPFSMPTAKPENKAVEKAAEEPAAPAPEPAVETEPDTEPAPHYRVAEVQGRNCGMCRFGTSDGWCTLYEFTYRSDMVCDAWASRVNLSEVAPKPKGDESKDTFITRCRADASFSAAVADDDQRALACDCQHKAVEDPREGEVQRLIDGLRRELAAIFSQECKAIVDSLHGRKAVGSFDPVEIEKILAEFTEPIRLALTEWLTPQVLAGGVEALSVIGGDSAVWTVSNPFVERWLRGYTAKLAGHVQQTTLRELSNTLATGVSRGEATGDLAFRVDQLFKDGYRSEMIARTESGRAYVRGEIEAWKQSEMVEGREWVLAAGGCDLCKAANQAFAGKVVGLEEPFMRLGDSLPYTRNGKPAIFVCDYMDIYGGDLHPHDRCGIRAVLKKPEE